MLGENESAIVTDAIGADVPLTEEERCDVPELRYTTLGEGDDQATGVMDASAFLPADAPASWSVYFGLTTPTPRWSRS